MYLSELDNASDEVDAILVAADQLESLHKQGQLKNNWSLDQFTKWLNSYLYQIDSNVILSSADILKMVSSQQNPFKKTIQNIQNKEVVFKGNQGQPPPENTTSDSSKDVVSKMAKKTINR